MKKTNHINVIKSTGERVPFEPDRLRHSLERSGAGPHEVNRIIHEINASAYDGITTREIYRKAFSMLRKGSRPTAARYKLKKAIFELGPSGFPFEKFIAALLVHEGFVTHTNVVIEGHCVNHEVDVVAQKGDLHYMVECKFHMSDSKFCDVKVPLYIQSRFKDVERAWLKHPDHAHKFHQGWIYTNTRFSSDAIQYGQCAGLELIGWNYPKPRSLNERIDALGLHPITALTTLTKSEKNKLLAEGIVLCKELCGQPVLLERIGIAQKRHGKIIQEARDVCKQ